MKVTFLYHSAVMVEMAQHILIFDAYKSPLPYVNPQKKVYLFYSHAHHDHYHPAILNHLKDNMTVVVASDIKLPKNLKHPAYQMQDHEKLEIEPLTIETLASNDEGVAFIVQCENKTIYHSGDLNYWHWQDEEDKILDAKYLEELKKIQGRAFDLACVPLDPRLEEYMFGGIELFSQYATAKAILPIHSWQRFDSVSQLIQKRPDLPILQVNKENMIFEIEVNE